MLPRAGSPPRGGAADASFAGTPEAKAGVCPLERGPAADRAPVRVQIIEAMDYLDQGLTPAQLPGVLSGGHEDVAIHDMHFQAPGVCA